MKFTGPAGRDHGEAGYGTVPAAELPFPHALAHAETKPYRRKAREAPAHGWRHGHGGARAMDGSSWFRFKARQFRLTYPLSEARTWLVPGARVARAPAGPAPAPPAHPAVGRAWPRARAHGTRHTSPGPGDAPRDTRMLAALAYGLRLRPPI
jgi:hypothetical protein